MLYIYIIIHLEWNNAVRDKWNSKSIYVVGKATAALGELLVSLCLVLLINLCHINANSSRVWQAPGASRHA